MCRPGGAPTVADTRAKPDAMNDVGIEQMVNHYAELIGTPKSNHRARSFLRRPHRPGIARRRPRRRLHHPRPLFEDAGANFSRHSPAKVDTHKADRGPLLLTSGREDHTAPSK